MLYQAYSKGTFGPIEFFLKKLQGTVKKKNGRLQKTGHCKWHISDQGIYGIVAIIFKFRSWVILATVRIKVQTDHKGIQTWTKEDVDRREGPIDRRCRWHQLLSCFAIELADIPSETNTVADVLFWWAYPSYTASQDVGNPGTQAVHESWDASEREIRNWSDEQLSGQPVTAYDERQEILTEQTWGGDDLSSDLVEVSGVQVGCTLPVIEMDIRVSVQIWDEGVAASQIPPSPDLSD